MDSRVTSHTTLKTGTQPAGTTRNEDLLRYQLDSNIIAKAEYNLHCLTIN